MTNLQELRKIVNMVPPVELAFAYGSGVFQQPQLRKLQPPMLDYILVVKDQLDWHKQNLAVNSEHYSFVGRLGPQAVCWVAEVVAPKVYYNTMIPLNGTLFKYGVITLRDLEEDLTSWKQLYAAGRMQKPMALLASTPPALARFSLAQQENLRAALAAALLLLPTTFNTTDLLHKICSLSYFGDIRLGLAEDSRKVQKIVAGSRVELEQLYVGLLQGEIGILAKVTQIEQELWTQEMDYTGRLALLKFLPEALACQLGCVQHGTHSKATPDLLFDQKFVELELQGKLMRALKQIVGRSSRKQVLAACLSAGAPKSLGYLMRKVSKSWELER